MDAFNSLKSRKQLENKHFVDNKLFCQRQGCLNFKVSGQYVQISQMFLFYARTRKTDYSLLI